MSVRESESLICLHFTLLKINHGFTTKNNYSICSKTTLITNLALPHYSNQFKHAICYNYYANTNAQNPPRKS